MENETPDKRVNTKLPMDIHKAIQYAKIETGDSSEKIVVDALREHLIKLGFLTREGNLVKPEIKPTGE